MTIREASRIYSTSIQDRISGRTSDAMKKRGPDPILTLEGEEHIVNWLINLGKCGFPLKKSELLDTVQKNLKDKRKPYNFKDDHPGF